MNQETILEVLLLADLKTKIDFGFEALSYQKTELFWRSRIGKLVRSLTFHGYALRGCMEKQESGTETGIMMEAGQNIP